MSDQKTLKTLTLASMGIKIPAGGGEFLGKAIVAVHGMVSGYFLKSTQYGESIALNGQFEALNVATGEMFFANTYYPPKDFGDMIRNRLEARKDEKEEVEFSAQITVAGSERAARGYTFVAEPIQTVEVYNRRLVFLKELQTKTKDMLQIAAPKKESKK